MGWDVSSGLQTFCVDMFMWVADMGWDSLFILSKNANNDNIKNNNIYKNKS